MQFPIAPRTVHLAMAQHIFSYLQAPVDHGLTLNWAKALYIVLAYSNATWADCPDSSHFTIKYALFLAPNLISLCSRKQPMMSKSSIEAELYGDCFNCY